MREINPHYTTIGKIVGDGVFEVPKYQRNYAWSRDQLEDFFNDIRKCLNARLKGDERGHFFGGIVTVENDISGTSEKVFHLVDGQQRMASFVILASQIINVLETLRDESEEEDEESRKKIKGAIKNLESKYIETTIHINLNARKYNRLRLSGPDDAYFQKKVRLKSADPADRASRLRLEYAFSYLNSRLEKLVKEESDIPDKLKVISSLITVLEVDCTLINIVTGDRQYAYELFQVLNDRGIQLTVGDLLRAKTLELLEGYNLQQSAAEKHWDNILKDEASDTKNFLSWIHSAFKGKRPRKSSLYDDCLDAFYPQHTKDSSITGTEADEILKMTKAIREEVDHCRKYVRGEWPFESPSVSQVQKNGLRLLTVELGNTSSIPVLIGARHAGEKEFGEVVDLTTRFFFRYRTVGSKHATPIINLYASEGYRILNKPEDFKIESYKGKLSTLIAKKVLMRRLLRRA